MSERPRRSAPTIRLSVLRTERVTPHLVRITAGGPGIAAFHPNEFTDQYVKVAFRVPGVDYPEPFDIATVRATLPREQWPRLRTYTVRRFDAQSGELTLDVVHHGDNGLAGPWAATARPGDELLVLGPGGAYAPTLDADWHLLVGDESALPAIAVSLERLPAGARAVALVEVADAAEQQQLDTAAAEVTLRWLHRGADPQAPSALPDAVRALDFPPGQAVQAFVHGEAGFVREIRRLLLHERGVDRALLSASGYWRRGLDDEGWRAVKSQEKALDEEADRAAQAARG